MDYLKALKRLGFTDYEARAFVSLARLGPSTVREVVLESKLPRNKAYEALQRLEEKNWVASLPVSPRKYNILNPERLKTDFQKLSTSIDSLVKTVESPKQRQFMEFFWIIRSKKAVVDKFSEQHSKVKREIQVVTNLSKILPKNIRTMRQAVERGVKVRMVCSFNPSRRKVYKAWLSSGAEIRAVVPKSSDFTMPRFSIFDSSTAAITIGFPEVREEKDYITLWAESKAFAQVLKTHFLHLWKHSKPVEKFLEKKQGGKND
ncbi:MAG: TrmB family transcriptional regulator [Candidatus Diapherotrites archaeon]|uniref:TrmB family transcriptional regulator n=1 Tax=Candidatus Iainarchaeum sp. TaxID=3101447 RepID=A0A7J4KTX6_9ARCH|nr:MAG: hypothetical protein QT12_C0007G0024 [archaeon GW2011_AR21]MBS3058249.1 TrmB family transcriptional regulator [Candidatus Diapherotrites archaeon]HIH21918.1 TrmB family transcriptional regulator [Candidatus Diapherotrites archaeon]HIH33382.1 TrmB family transcriptional regulator [Candidatus Diapherotrites archaeon]